MQTKTLYAALVAAAFAIPLSVNATDKTAGTTASQAQATTTAAVNDGGAEAMFKSMDKDGDGFISKEEAKGTPHDAAFSTLDTNGDGKLSRTEHAAAPEHVSARTKSGTTTDSTASGSTASGSTHMGTTHMGSPTTDSTASGSTTAGAKKTY